MEKIVTSQNQDMKHAFNELTTALNDVDFLKTRLSTIETLAKKQSEEIEALNKRYKGLKRVRIGSICVGGAGLFIGATGYFLQKNDDTKDLGKMMFYTGATALGCSAATFGLSFSIPF